MRSSTSERVAIGGRPAGLPRAPAAPAPRCDARAHAGLAVDVQHAVRAIAGEAVQSAAAVVLERPREHADAGAVQRGSDAVARFDRNLTSLEIERVVQGKEQIRCPLGCQARQLVSTWTTGYRSRCIPMSEIRTEHDMLGAVSVPAAALYGAQTVRAAANFGTTSADSAIGLSCCARRPGQGLRGRGEPRARRAGPGDRRCDRARGRRARRRHPRRSVPRRARAGRAAARRPTWPSTRCSRIAPRSCWAPSRAAPTSCTRSTTSIARSRRTTSSRRPSALAVQACARRAGRSRRRDRALEGLARRPAGPPARRTCLQDAVPLPIAAYHGAQVTVVRRAAAELSRSVEALLEVPLGATAVGTGIGARRAIASAPSSCSRRARAFAAAFGRTSSTRSPISTRCCAWPPRPPWPR